MKWIQLQGHRAWHAVFVEIERGIHTYCDRPVPGIAIERSIAISGTDVQPRSRCTACSRRIAKPYLVPERMRDMLRSAGADDDAVHLRRWKELHLAFDELLSAYLVRNRDKVPSTTTAMELLQWSFQQAKGAL